MADMKTTFSAIFDPTWTHLLAPKDPNKEFLEQHFSQETNYIINFVTLRLTNLSETLENSQFFAIFDPNCAKIWP